MSFKFQLPSLTENMSNQQLRSYLQQMSEQLEYALNNMTVDSFTPQAKEQLIDNSAEATAEQVNESAANLRAMIIKNAEVIESAMDELTRTMHGEYTALSSQFGQYRETTDARITENATGITQAYNYASSIDTKYNAVTGDTNTALGNLRDGAVAANSSYRVETEAYIKTGLLYYDGLIPIYGVGIGQDIETSLGSRTGLYAVYTAGEMAFYKNDHKIAYFQNDKLFVVDAEFAHSIKMGDWLLEQDDVHGFSIKYLGA